KQDFPSLDDLFSFKVTKIALEIVFLILNTGLSIRSLALLSLSYFLTHSLHFPDKYSLSFHIKREKFSIVFSFSSLQELQFLNFGGGNFLDARSIFLAAFLGISYNLIQSLH